MSLLFGCCSDLRRRRLPRRRSELMSACRSREGRDIAVEVQFASVHLRIARPSVVAGHPRVCFQTWSHDTPQLFLEAHQLGIGEAEPSVEEGAGRCTDATIAGLHRYNGAIPALLRAIRSGSWGSRGQRGGISRTSRRFNDCTTAGEYNSPSYGCRDDP